jgi:hypothetical protein
VYLDDKCKVLVIVVSSSVASRFLGSNLPCFSLCHLVGQIEPRPPLCEVYRPHTSRDTHPLELLCTSSQPFAEAANYATRNKHKGKTFIPSAGFEPAITATKRLQTYALDGTATTVGISFLSTP